MPLQQLESYQFRNLQNPSITLGNNLNIIFGNNASGKTSLLEAMHVLSCGKSFLSASPAKLQKFDTHDFSLNGELTHNAQRHRFQYLWKDRCIRLSIDNQYVPKISQYAQIQPVQAITPSSFLLLDDSPDRRRRFIDWGVFHVKHTYIDVWSAYQRSLVQRNTVLRQGRSETLNAWDAEYIKPCLQINDHRTEYVNDLNQQFIQIMQRLIPDHVVTIQYHRGWPDGRDLLELLHEYKTRDLERGYTFFGPQRAELNIMLDGRSVRDTASRGQKKLIAYALFIAQAQLQQINGEYSGLLLVDDLPSELDHHHQESVLELLERLPMQVVMTCINLDDIKKYVNKTAKVFHVKQGLVQEVLQ